jgi:hypothetical protein
LEQVGVELAGGVRGVEDLGGGIPTLGGSLLEQPEAVPVSVVEVTRIRLLQGGGQGYGLAGRGDAAIALTTSRGADIAAMSAGLIRILIHLTTLASA